MTAYSQVESVPNTPVRPASRTAQKARTRALVALSVALVAGIGASFLIYRAMQRQAEPSAAMPMRKVVTTRLELPVATTLTAEMLAVTDWPESGAPPGAIDDPEKCVGRVLRTGVVPGDAIVEARLAPKEGGRGLAAMIPPGHRAMTVRVNESSGVAGFIHPGDLVDVVATMMPNRDQDELRSRIVLQNIKVLAVGQELQTGTARPIQVPVVTLLVAPEDSERLALAASHGDLQLTMRSGIDTQQMVTAGVSPRELFAIEVPAEAEKPGANIVVTEKAERASRPRHRRESTPLPPATTIVTSREPEKREEVIEIIRGPKTEQRKLRLPETPPQGGR